MQIRLSASRDNNIRAVGSCSCSAFESRVGLRAPRQGEGWSGRELLDRAPGFEYFWPPISKPEFKIFVGPTVSTQNITNAINWLHLQSPPPEAWSFLFKWQFCEILVCLNDGFISTCFLMMARPCSTWHQELRQEATQCSWCHWSAGISKLGHSPFKEDLSSK